jgi:hypothetical protein
MLEIFDDQRELHCKTDVTIEKDKQIGLPLNHIVNN